MAYGAWATNPVPIDETAPLRPNPGHAEAAAAAEAERQARRWAGSGPGRELVVLRPVPVVAPGLGPPAHLPLVDSSAPLQFLHPEDFESALSLAATIDPGTYNVAPDGAVDADTARALVRGVATPGLPRRLARLLAGWSGRLSAPARVSFSTFPWVVDNARLKAAGWAPEHGSDEAWVAAYPGSELAELPAGRRQKVVLALLVSLGGLAGLGVLELVRRNRRRS
jgi:nucleoside-diphosphate-sugar epimerase